MEHQFRQTQSQKMVLSPQMREYLRLLHLPLADLHQAVEKALEENPILEEVPKDTEEDIAELASTQSKKEKEAEEDPDNESLVGSDWDDQEPLVFTKPPVDFSKRNPIEARKVKDFQETLITQPESLFDYLEWQLHFLELTPEQKQIAEYIIGNINPDGYLTVSLDDIATATKHNADKVQEVFEKILQLDPPGVGARDLREALLIQLERKGPGVALAKEIVRDHLDLLAKKDFRMLSKIFNASDPAIKKAADQISRLEPKPGRSFYSEEAIAITPDATVSIKDGTQDGLEIEVHKDFIPTIRINPEYRNMIREKNVDTPTKEFLKTRLANGLDFLKALELRGSTLKAITEEIVRAQPLFFTRGFSELRPLRLKDIAERLDLHESTISRAIHGKYLKTPQGTIPYKSFFSQKLATADGEGESQKSIMERIRGMVEKEDPKKPLSDQAIVKVLEAEGITIARRTVAKYREALKILPTHLRRQHS